MTAVEQPAHLRPVVHVLYVPHGWTLESVLLELDAYGRVRWAPWWLRWTRYFPGRNGHWEVLRCDGAPCICPPDGPVEGVEP